MIVPFSVTLAIYENVLWLRHVLIFFYAEDTMAGVAGEDGVPHHGDWDLSCKVFVGGLRDDANKYDIEYAFRDGAEKMGNKLWGIIPYHD